MFYSGDHRKVVGYIAREQARYLHALGIVDPADVPQPGPEECAMFPGPRPPMASVASIADGLRQFKMFEAADEQLRADPNAQIPLEAVGLYIDQRIAFGYDPEEQHWETHLAVLAERLGHAAVA